MKINPRKTKEGDRIPRIGDTSTMCPATSCLNLASSIFSAVLLNHQP
jgi:hypothetical protein